MISLIKNELNSNADIDKEIAHHKPNISLKAYSSTNTVDISGAIWLSSTVFIFVTYLSINSKKLPISCVIGTIYPNYLSSVCGMC